MIVQANDKGFTVWAEEGFIIFDCPFERLKEDHRSCMNLIYSLHEVLYPQGERK